jgi:ERCC4-type nuclease
MQIILDCREHTLKDACNKLINTSEKFKDLNITSKNLDIGDMIICDDKGKELVIFERKTISDLIASIKDSRYSEQSYRLNGISHPNHNIINLIEGPIGKFNEKQMVYSAMFSLNYYKGFSVFRSQDINETAYILCNATMKISKEKDKEPYYKEEIKKGENEAKEQKDEASYSTVIKKKKNANITPNNFGEIVLCQIPSISSTTAIAIMDEYGNINNLINSIKEDRNCLDEITYLTEKKQRRKISKTSIKNILEFLIND